MSFFSGWKPVLLVEIMIFNDNDDNVVTGAFFFFKSKPTLSAENATWHVFSEQNQRLESQDAQRMHSVLPHRHTRTYFHDSWVVCWCDPRVCALWLRHAEHIAALALVFVSLRSIIHLCLVALAVLPWVPCVFIHFSECVNPEVVLALYKGAQSKGEMQMYVHVNLCSDVRD